jgi:ADP-heptose:LPS heptosyltransferase
MNGPALVLFPGALGDFICFLPTLDCIAEQSPVHVLARSEFAGLAPPLVKITSFERFEIRNLFVPGGAKDSRVRQFFESYACIYSWMGSGEPIFRGELKSATRGQARLFSFRPNVRMHQADYYLSCLKKEPMFVLPRVHQQPDASAWAQAYWEQYSLGSKSVLAIAPGSGAREKNWPVESFEMVAQCWRERSGGVVLIILGPAEEEHGGYDSLCRHSLVIRGTNISRLAALLRRCSLYIGNDSGISHLAAAVGVPTVAVFGPSDVAQWAPRGKSVLVQTLNVRCSPCTISAMKQCPHRQCLTAFDPIQIIRRVEQWQRCLT